MLTFRPFCLYLLRRNTYPKFLTSLYSQCFNYLVFKLVFKLMLFIALQEYWKMLLAHTCLSLEYCSSMHWLVPIVLNNNDFAEKIVHQGYANIALPSTSSTCTSVVWWLDISMLQSFESFTKHFSGVHDVPNIHHCFMFWYFL